MVFDGFGSLLGYPGAGLGHLGAILGRPGAFLEPLGTILGPLGAVPSGLGASWGGPREVLGHLGAILGPLGRLLWGYVPPIQFLIDFGIDLGLILRVKRIIKWNPKRTRIEPKIQHKTRRLSRSPWNRLGPVLGHFGVHLGIKNYQVSLV